MLVRRFGGHWTTALTSLTATGATIAPNNVTTTGPQTYTGDVPPKDAIAVPDVSVPGQGRTEQAEKRGLVRDTGDGQALLLLVCLQVAPRIRAEQPVDLPLIDHMSVYGG